MAMWCSAGARGPLGALPAWQLQRLSAASAVYQGKKHGTKKTGQGLQGPQGLQGVRHPGAKHTHHPPHLHMPQCCTQNTGLQGLQGLRHPGAKHTPTIHHTLAHMPQCCTQPASPLRQMHKSALLSLSKIAKNPCRHPRRNSAHSG